jgi:hypothetical protein
VSRSLCQVALVQMERGIYTYNSELPVLMLNELERPNPAIVLLQESTV